MNDEPLENEEPVARTRRLQELRASLRELSDSGSAQPALFSSRIAGDDPPLPAITGDDLMLRFGISVGGIRENDPGHLPADCVVALEAIERQLATISRDAVDFDADVWTDEAMRESVQWAEVRRLADAALEALDRPGDDPPGDSGEAAPVRRP
jgi:hypothetical protein